MKELYTTPELELLCLTAEEQLANSGVDFDKLLGELGGSDDAVKESVSDIEIPLN